MDAVSKINRCGTCRKILDIPLGCKTIYTIREQIQITLNEVKELLIIRHVPLPFQNLSEPRKLGFFTVIALGSVYILLIFPVCCDTVFSGPVHLICSYLYFKRLTVRCYKSCMQ